LPGLFTGNAGGSVDGLTAGGRHYEPGEGAAVRAGMRLPASPGYLVQVIRHGLKKIQYRPGLIEGCLAGTGLAPEPDEHLPRSKLRISFTPFTRGFGSERLAPRSIN
jgi:hypothetical protein